MSKRPAPTQEWAGGGPPAQRRRHVPGGVRQQLAWQAPDAEQDEEGDGLGSLSDLLVMKWAWGSFSARLVQQVAAASVADGLNKPFVRKLATLGSSGRLPQHCHSDLLRHLPTTHLHEALYEFAVWVAKPPAGIIQVGHEILLPHQLLHAMYTHHKDVFVRRLLGGSENNVQRFWEQMTAHPAYDQHPLSRRPDHKAKCIPIALHGDGVPVAGIGKSWSKSMDAYSWASLLTTGSVADCHFLIYAMFTKLAVRMPNRNFTEEFMKLLAWSLYWMFLGVWPKRDYNGNVYPPGSALAARGGQPLAGGFYCAVWCVRGDLDHMCKVYGFPMWNTATPCALCRANRTDIPWTDARPHAAWRSTVFTNETWRVAVPRRHVLFELPGAGILTYLPDVMHMLHLGVYQYFMGSVLELLVYYIMPDSPESNLSVVWDMIRNVYKAPRFPDGGRRHIGISCAGLCVTATNVHRRPPSGKPQTGDELEGPLCELAPVHVSPTAREVPGVEGESGGDPAPRACARVSVPVSDECVRQATSAGQARTLRHGPD